VIADNAGEQFQRQRRRLFPEGERNEMTIPLRSNNAGFSSIRTSVFTLERYVTEVLMRDLIAHDHLPSAFLIYLFLRGRATVPKSSQQTPRRKMHPVTISVRELATQTGLAKSVVQTALTALRRRQLIRVVAPDPIERHTIAASYEVLRPWRRTSRRSQTFSN
jgi:hypothetical protein